MAAFIYNLCQNVYKNIFYVSVINNLNKKLDVNYLFKQLFEITHHSPKLSYAHLYNRNILTSKYFNKTNPTNIFIQNDYKMERQLSKYFQSVRTYTTDPPVPKRTLPPLMEFPEVIWPSIFKSLRNWILSTFIIAPYFDREFSLHDFVVGSKKALEVVSTNLAAGNFKELEGLVTEDALKILTKTVSNLSLAQRQQLAVDSRDVYFSFPYQVGIMFDESESPQQKRFVEITMVYHILQGLHMMRERGEEPPMNVGMLPEFREKIFICNYRFIKEFTKGVEDQWTVNLVHHFKPSDFVQ